VFYAKFKIPENRAYQKSTAKGEEEKFYAVKFKVQC
jgi:hypothetical protein